MSLSCGMQRCGMQRCGMQRQTASLPTLASCGLANRMGTVPTCTRSICSEQPSTSGRDEPLRPTTLQQARCRHRPGRRRVRAGPRHGKAATTRAASAAAAGALADEEARPKRSGGPLQAWRDFWDLGPSDADPQVASGQVTATLGKLATLVTMDKGLLWSGGIFMIVGAVSELAIPQCMSSALFALTKDGATAKFTRSVQLLAAASVSYGIFTSLRGWVFSLINTNMLQRLRQRVFNALTEQDMGFFEVEEVGVLTSRLGSDCQVIARLFSTNINVALRNGVQMVGGAAILAALCPQLAATTAAVTAVLWAVAARYGDFSRRMMKAYQDRLAETNQVAEEVFSLIGTVRTFGTEAREQGRYGRCLSELRSLSVKGAAAYLLYLLINGGLYHMNKVVTLVVGGMLLSRGVISGEQLMTFVLYVDMVSSSSLAVCDQWGPFMEAIGASERIVGYLDRPRAPQLAPGRIMSHVQGSIELRDVSFNYPSRPHVPALVGVQLSIPAGTTAALVGRSGSGKSTLVALVQRLYDPDHGQVLIDGVDVRTLDATWLRRQVAVVDQNPRLFSTTLADNIAYGLPEASREDVVAAALEANAHEFIVELPHGYDTLVTTDLLSGGQRQRIALARALLRRPRLLILDEATSALDAHSEAAVQAALARAMRTLQCTVIVIAHRLSTVRSADCTVVMHEGRCAEMGTHRELMRRGGLYAALVHKQQSGLTDEGRDMAPSEAKEGEQTHTHASHDVSDDAPNGHVDGLMEAGARGGPEREGADAFDGAEAVNAGAPGK